MKGEAADKKSENEYSVSSASAQPSRTVSFNLPNVRRPNWQLSRSARSTAATGLAAFILIAGISGFAGAAIENRHNNGIISGSLNSQDKVVTSASQLISQNAKTVGPSVVSVNVNISSTSSGTSSSLGSLFGLPQSGSQQAAGTGIIISSDGLIVTNRHVVPAGTTSVSVTLSDGTQLKDVSVLGRTSDSDSLDVAFLKVNNAAGHKLTPAVIGDSSTVQVGDDVVAIGNALGQFQNTVTSGIISGYGRSVQAGDASGSTSAENLDDLFQTDAAINEGNSGGPLVNLNGQVVGINTAIAGNAQNIGFAIPINDVKGLIDQVVKTGKFSRPYLGVRYIPVTADVATEFNLSVTNGAFIAPSSDTSQPSIVDGSPAASANLQVNDVITEINSTKIDQIHSLTSLLDKYQPGDKVTLTIVRGGKTVRVDITLGTAPNN